MNAQTDRLQTALPHGAQNWGAARKALNVFLRDVCYNRFLGERHGLTAVEGWLEIPLDQGLKTAEPSQEKPSIQTEKSLNPAHSSAKIILNDYDPPSTLLSLTRESLRARAQGRKAFEPR